MIAFAEPLAAGNAVRLHLSPPRGALEWRVLRRPTDDFSGAHDDPGALRVGAECGPRPGAILDTEELLNGAEVFYRFFWRDAQGWHAAGASRRATPAATYAGEGPDAQAVLHERLVFGIAEEVRRGALKPAGGKVLVTKAPAGVPDERKLPLVSVHLEHDLPAHRFLGEQVETEFPTGIGSEAHGSEGQFSRVALNVVAVSLNGDERIALRKAIKRIVVANGPVFDEAGLLQCELALRDEEDLGAGNAVLYRVAGLFSCTAPAVVSWPVSVVRDVVVTASFPDEPEDP